jgi:hypothetical protein
MRKFWLKSKTVLAALFLLLLGSAEQFAGIDWRAILLAIGVPEPKVGGLLALIGLLFLVLRLIGGGLVLRRCENGDDPR